MDEVCWGMIGCGNVTETKSGPAFYKLEKSSVLAVMCRHIDSAKDYAVRHQIPYYYNDADLIFQNPLINAVYIATPVKYHAPYATMAMKTGKVVYVEKPMALNYLQCLELRNISEQTGSKLFVAYYRRSLEYFLKVKKLIDKKLIGDVIQVSVSLQKPARKEDYNKNNLPWRVLPELSGGGYFHDLACHQFDILDFLMGPIQSAEGCAENLGGLYPAEDTVQAKWKFNSGIEGIGNWSFICKDHDKQDNIILTGTKGRISFSTFDFTPILLEVNNTFQRFEVKPPIHIQMPFIKSIISELTDNTFSDANLDSAVNTSKIMEDIICKK